GTGRGALLAWDVALDLGAGRGGGAAGGDALGLPLLPLPTAGPERVIGGFRLPCLQDAAGDLVAERRDAGVVLSKLQDNGLLRGIGAGRETESGATDGYSGVGNEAANGHSCSDPLPRIGYGAGQEHRALPSSAAKTPRALPQDL